MKTKDIVLIGMFAAVLAVISQISLPMPTGVPITIQLFGISLVGNVLGAKRGFLATLVYILLGAAGLPVFANFHGGLASLTGMSGGYILAWPVMALLCGFRPALPGRAQRLAANIALTVIGVLFVEAVGGWQWSVLAGDKSFTAIMLYSFVAFIPKDIIISVLAILVGDQLKNRFRSQQVLTEARL